MDRTDVQIAGCGTVYTFELLTHRAEQWVKLHIQDPIYLAGRLVVEHRYAGPLAQGMYTDGLNLE